MNEDIGIEMSGTVYSTVVIYHHALDSSLFHLFLRIQGTNQLDTVHLLHSHPISIASLDPSTPVEWTQSKSFTSEPVQTTLYIRSIEVL